MLYPILFSPRTPFNIWKIPCFIAIRKLSFKFSFADFFNEEIENYVEEIENYVEEIENYVEEICEIRTNVIFFEIL